MKTAKKYDAIIVGGGPAGATTALHLLNAGIKPVIIEKETFPRYRIGESLTGEAGASLRALGLEEWMNEMKWPVKYGVNVFGPNGSNSFWVPVAKRDENKKLVLSTTWQVRRSTFDQKLLDLALERGAELMPCRAIDVVMEGDRAVGLKIRTPNGQTETLSTEVVVDASGQTTFLANSSAPTGAKERGKYDKQVAIFSQVTDAVRDPGDGDGNTLIFYQKKNHWAWFIPIDSEVTSIGVVVPGPYYSEKKLSKHEFLVEELKTLNPELARRIQNTTFVEDVHSVSNYSYHVKQFTGKGFMCVGDSHRFIDPVFSFGVNFALKEAGFAAQAIAQHLSGEAQNGANPFAEYQAICEEGQDIIQDVVDVFWDHPLAFAGLVHHKYTEGMTDYFAGRIYRDNPGDRDALLALRRCKYGEDYTME